MTRLEAIVCGLRLRQLLLVSGVLSLVSAATFDQHDPAGRPICRLALTSFTKPLYQQNRRVTDGRRLTDTLRQHSPRYAYASRGTSSIQTDTHRFMFPAIFKRLTLL